MKHNILTHTKYGFVLIMGIVGFLILRPSLINIPFFDPLKDVELLKNFRLTDTLEWMDGKIDIAPEYLYEHGVIAYPNKEIESGCVAEDKNTFIQDPEITEIAHSYAEVKQGKAKTNSISKLLSEL